MTYQFYTLTLGALLSLFSFNLHAQGFSVTIDSFEVLAGQDVCVPVRAKGFKDIVSFQFSLTWDPQVLKFKKTQNYGLPNWDSISPYSYFYNDHLLSGWANPLVDCYTTADGDTLFEVCFSAIGQPGTSTNIKPVNTGFPPGNGESEAYNCAFQDIWFPAGNDTGFVKIVALSGTSDLIQNSENNFLLFPNPATSSTQVVFQSPNSGNSMLIVTDALGRIVFQQKITKNIGENRFDIPANALKDKGMYQVSLQTKDGVQSQILSVK